MGFCQQIISRKILTGSTQGGEHSHHVPHAEPSQEQNLLQGQGTHSHPLPHRERDWSGKKKKCKKASLGAGSAAWRGWPPLEQPGGQAVPHTAPGVEIGAADMCKEEPAPKGVWSSLLGKARGKPGKAASQGGRTLLDVILFLILKLNDKSVSRRA